MQLYLCACSCTEGVDVQFNIEMTELPAIDNQVAKVLGINKDRCKDAARVHT
jgi:hypothetical protein